MFIQIIDKEGMMDKKRTIGLLSQNKQLIEKAQSASADIEIIPLFHDFDPSFDAMSIFTKLIILVRQACSEIYVDCDNKVISSPSVWGAIYLIAEIVERITLFNASEVMKVIKEVHSKSFYQIFYPADKIRLLPDEFDEILNKIKAE